MSMEAPYGQNHDNKIAVQVNFNPTAANIMDLLHILSSINNTFFSVLVIIFSNKSYFCFNYRNTFFIHAMNYFSVVLWIITSTLQGSSTSNPFGSASSYARPSGLESRDPSWSSG